MSNTHEQKVMMAKAMHPELLCLDAINFKKIDGSFEVPASDFGDGDVVHVEVFSINLTGVKDRYHGAGVLKTTPAFSVSIYNRRNFIPDNMTYVIDVDTITEEDVINVAKRHLKNTGHFENVKSFLWADKVIEYLE